MTATTASSLSEQINKFSTELSTFSSQLEVNCRSLRLCLSSPPLPFDQGYGQDFIHNLSVKVDNFKSWVDSVHHSLENEKAQDATHASSLHSIIQTYNDNNQNIQLLENHLYLYGYQRLPFFQHNMKIDIPEKVQSKQTEKKARLSDLMADISLSESAKHALDNEKKSQQNPNPNFDALSIFAQDLGELPQFESKNKETIKQTWFVKMVTRDEYNQLPSYLHSVSFDEVTLVVDAINNNIENLDYSNLDSICISEQSLKSFLPETENNQEPSFVC